MKKRYLAVPFLCAVAFTSAGIALTSASALDDSKPALSVNNVNLDWAGIMIQFPTETDTGLSTTTIPAEGLEHFIVKDPTGADITDQASWVYNNNYIFSWSKKDYAVGTTLTLEQGFVMNGYEMKSDISYLYATEGSPWVVFDPTYLTPSTTALTVYVDSTATVTFTTNYSIAPLTCTVEDGTKASVVSDGLTATVTGLAEGTTTLNVACGDQTATVNLTVEKMDATLESISVTGELNAYKGASAIDFSTLTATKIYDDGSEVPFNVDASMISGDYDLSVVDDYTLTVTVEGKTAQVTLHVNPMPALSVNNVNLDWASIMIHFPTEPDTGLSTTTLPAEGVEHFIVKDPTGADITSQANWVYNNNYIFSWTKNDYAVGTTLTLEQGFVMNGYEMKEDVTYLYDAVGSSWVEFKPTEVTATQTDLTVHEGESTTVTFATVPAYTNAPFTYTGVDTNVATVAFDGYKATVSGVAIGETSLTFTCGGVSKTVNINVIEATVLNSISVSGELTVSKGSAIDYSTLQGTKHYSDGSTLPFDVDQSMITGSYDLNVVGDYTLTVTLDGKTAQVALHVVNLPALTVGEINIVPSGWGIMIRFNEKNSGLTTSIIPESGLVGLEVKDSSGTNVMNQYNWLYHEDFIFGAPTNQATHVFEIGMTITISQGFVFHGYEVKETATYVYAAAGATLGYYDAATQAPTGVTVASPTDNPTTYVKSTLQLQSSVTPATAATTVKYTSSNPAIATVDTYTGVVTGVAVGEVTIYVTAGSATTSILLHVEPELEFQDRLAFTNVYKIWVQKGAEFTIPSDIKVAPVYIQEGNDVYGIEFALNLTTNCAVTVDTSVTGDAQVTAKVTYEGVQYDMVLDVKVYEVEDMVIKELAIVEWFAFSTFIQFPASTTNLANITDPNLIPNANLLTYTRADGTNVPVGVYNLGTGNIAILPSFEYPVDGDGNRVDMNLENFNQAPFYQEGDTITLQAGLTGYLWTGDFAPTATDSNAIKVGTGMVIPECVLSQTVSYVFDGSVWMLYIAYTDFEVNATAEVNVGSAVSLGAVRVPDNATEGVFTYVSSDTSIVTVNANGRITGVKEGTATITVTLDEGVAGKIVKTVTVTVTDGIVRMEIPDGTTLTVTQGTDNLDLSKVPATFVWASGKTETADLTNATVIGYDKDTLGETEVTIRVTVNGKPYQTQLTVIVTEDENAGSGTVGNDGSGNNNGNTDNNGNGGSGDGDATGSTGCAGCSSSADVLSIVATATLMLGAVAIIRSKRKSNR